MSDRAAMLGRAAVGLGLSVHELRRSRRAVVLAAGVRDVTAEEWRAARSVLERESQRAASGRCSTCSAWVFWGATVKGKSMPVDPLPHPRGNVTVARTPAGGARLTVHPNSALPLPPPAHRSHFVTCAQARQSDPVSAALSWARRTGRCVWCLQRLDQYWLDQGMDRHGPCVDESRGWPVGTLRAEVL
ncbi:MAG: hypothetical protein KBF43_08940 [Dermatophilaceae bacterium]|nr:hypothetical protein [Dermatophilaceae bacterium]